MNWFLLLVSLWSFYVIQFHFTSLLSISNKTFLNLLSSLDSLLLTNQHYANWPHWLLLASNYAPKDLEQSRSARSFHSTSLPSITVQTAAPSLFLKLEYLNSILKSHSALPASFHSLFHSVFHIFVRGFYDSCLTPLILV